ncbi:MAG: alkaline phosphatase family protein, partial [Chloroflexi bacterium]|nr:alkaline phosphatase family protein [Chloroflexota bacterium]
MVWDGLRPDLVSEQATPHLFRLAHTGVWFDRSHAVYPTLTRANAPAISTGCRPGRAGLPGNSFCLPTLGPLTPFSTGDAANLRRLAASDDRPILLVDTLADRVHRAGGRTVIVSSGSPGCALLQHPRAAECGDLIVSVGLAEMSGPMERLRERFGPPPVRRVPDTAWDAYSTRIITDYVLPELEPTLLVFWHTDPDHTTHDRGFSAPETARALRDADDNLGAILAAYEHLGSRQTTAVVVTSDHGGSTVTRRVRPVADLAGLLSEGAAAENGGSAFI